MFIDKAGHHLAVFPDRIDARMLVFGTGFLWPENEVLQLCARVHLLTRKKAHHFHVGLDLKGRKHAHEIQLTNSISANA